MTLLVASNLLKISNLKVNFTQNLKACKFTPFFL